MTRDEPVGAYVPGWSSLVEWFGYSPSFHDSEVVSIDLRREPEPSIVRLHVWHTSSDVTEQGAYRQDRHAHAVFSITGIRALTLEGWNHQNVLWGLEIDRAGENLIVRLQDSFGLAGEIIAAGIVVSVEPIVAGADP